MSDEQEQLSFGLDGEARPEPVDGSPHPPTPEQAAAIDGRRSDVFLEAGAGTGKTRVLVSRYCDAIDVDGVEADRVLAFTFTERAAGEMRRRIRIELARRAALATDAERRARLLAASRAGEGTPVTTIHGYCRRLLATHPVAAPRSPLPGPRRRRGLQAGERGVRVGALGARGHRPRGRLDRGELPVAPRRDHPSRPLRPPQPR